jgi:hypothetical protein
VNNLIPLALKAMGVYNNNISQAPDLPVSVYQPDLGKTKIRSINVPWESKKSCILHCRK